MAAGLLYSSAACCTRLKSKDLTAADHFLFAVKCTQKKSCLSFLGGKIHICTRRRVKKNKRFKNAMRNG